MTARLSAAIVTTCLAGTLWAQPAVTTLTSQQRELLSAMVAAVDGAAAGQDVDSASLRTHVLRASDGSHYVAFAVTLPPSATVPSGSRAVYVRLATAAATTSARPERSLMREWLAGTRSAPPAVMSNSGIALGEMPIMGVTAIMSPNRQPMTQGTADLAAITLERRRAREQQDERERQRRATLEGRSATASETLPFEDFDFASPASLLVQRALTAGPGDYFLFLSWADPASPKAAATVQVMKARLTLPPATKTDLAISGVILADGIQSRAAPYTAAEQASHPYSIGLTEIVPAADAVFRDDENIAAVFQVINPRAAESGKPNIDVAFEIVRVTNNEERRVAVLTPQNYSEKNLPVEFDLRAGHPLFASVSAPLASLSRGSYRLKILVKDSVSGQTAMTGTDFAVSATGLSLLKEAPPLGRPFERESFLTGNTLSDILSGLRPPSPSPALQRAFDLAAAKRFVDLMIEEPVPAEEDGVRAALRGIAQLAVGDTSAAVQFQRAQLLGAPLAFTRVLSGAARATQSRDADAIAAWQEALAAGAPRALVAPHLTDAYLRRGDYSRAAAMIADANGAPAGWSRSTAAILIATQKEGEAIPMLEARLASSPSDADAHWLLIHALYAQAVHGDTSNRARLVTEARRYVEANGAHAEIAREWLKAVEQM